MDMPSLPPPRRIIHGRQRVSGPKGFRRPEGEHTGSRLVSQSPLGPLGIDEPPGLVASVATDSETRGKMYGQRQRGGGQTQGAELAHYRVAAPICTNIHIAAPPAQNDKNSAHTSHTSHLHPHRCPQPQQQERHRMPRALHHTVSTPLPRLDRHHVPSSSVDEAFTAGVGPHIVDPRLEKLTVHGLGAHRLECDGRCTRDSLALPAHEEMSLMPKKTKRDMVPRSVANDECKGVSHAMQTWAWPWQCDFQTEHEYELHLN
ncbi:hypothetical protein K438DRAFT_1761754 [Mycena galopus ATCC 62051]|nr:hypothetical protein K438DRAFT_1761754 [Mycena galopus ATCC 62051]